MAQNPALTQLLTDLNAAPHPGMGNDFFAHVGSHMALARTVPPAWFPKTGTATEAQIGGLIANLHSLTTVAWGAYPLNGAANMTAWMIGSGHALLTAIPTTGTLRRVSKSLEGSTAVQGGGSCLFVSHRSVESSEIENYYSP